MIARKLLSGLLVCTGLHAQAQAGDHDCVIQFYLGKVGADGVHTTLMDCVTWQSNEATVELAPGELVRLTRHCPGCTYCPDQTVGLQRHVGPGPGHASYVDPILDTLPLSTGIGTDLATPGSYYMRGIAPGVFPVYASSLHLIIEGVPTAVGDDEATPFHVWAVQGGLAIRHAPAGMLSIMDMSGKLIHRGRVAANSGSQTVALPELPTGSYLVQLAADHAVLRRRIVVD